MWFPDMMKTAPQLDQVLATAPPADKTVLLINPFFRNDPRASFGKHVLTPTLALTSIAAVAPDSWQVRIWDENLLQGPTPVRAGWFFAESLSWMPWKQRDETR